MKRSAYFQFSFRVRKIQLNSKAEFMKTFSKVMKTDFFSKQEQNIKTHTLHKDTHKSQKSYLSQILLISIPFAGLVRQMC